MMMMMMMMMIIMIISPIPIPILEHGTCPKQKYPEVQVVDLWYAQFFFTIYFTNPCLRILLAWDKYPWAGTISVAPHDMIECWVSSWAVIGLDCLRAYVYYGYDI